MIILLNMHIVVATKEGAVLLVWTDFVKTIQMQFRKLYKCEVWIKTKAECEDGSGLSNDHWVLKGWNVMETGIAADVILSQDDFWQESFF